MFRSTSVNVHVYCVGIELGNVVFAQTMRPAGELRVTFVKLWS